MVTIPCECFFCGSGRPHPTTTLHMDFYDVSGLLTVPESLNPADVIAREACAICGHVRAKTSS